MKLQKIPRGLLELFRLRHTGELPDDFSKSVVPMVDTSAFYASDLLIPAASAPTVGAINLAVSLLETFTITSNLGCRSLGGQFTCGAAAATNVTFSWGAILPGFAVEAVMGDEVVANIAAGASVQFGNIFSRIVFPAGTTLYTRASGTAAGADHSLAIAGLLENLTGNAG